MERILLSFKVSSPGKVILHGEHSVVYGKPALAGVIGVRNFLYFHEHESGLICFKFDSLGTEFQFEISKLNELLGTIETFIRENDALEVCAVREVTTFITKHVAPVSQNVQDKKSLLSSLFLLCGILLEKEISNISKGFDIQIASEMSIGAGVGSSASFGVCLAAAFLVFARFNNVGEKPSDLSEEEKKYISKWAFQSERIMHGTPSGIDNTVCTFGNIVKFSKEKPIEHINIKSKINILLVDSKVSRSTANLVGKVAGLKNEFPTIVEHILDGMNEIVVQAIPLYESISEENKSSFSNLEKLFQINNDLLKAIGVSHPKLEEIFAIALANGYSSKITGAGGGGYVLVVLPHDYKEMVSFEKLCNDLRSSQFTYIETTVGGTGLIVTNLEENV